MHDADSLRELFGELLADVIGDGQRRGGHLYFASPADAAARVNAKTAPPVPAGCVVAVAGDDGGEYPLALELPARAGTAGGLGIALGQLALAVAARIGAAHPGGGAGVRVAIRASGSRVGCRIRFTPA